MFINILFILFALILGACSSLSLKVNTTPPEADVIVHTPNGSQKLGVSPLIIKDEQLQSLPEGFTLELSKEDHLQQTVMIEKKSITANGELTVKLKPLNKAEAKLNDPDVKAAVESIARQVAAIQSSLLKKEFIQAEILTRNLLNNYPNFSVGWNLLGNNYYLQGKTTESLSAYQKALTLEPDNVETRIILDKINRLPASQGGL